jgi:hypothetical protein
MLGTARLRLQLLVARRGRQVAAVLAVLGLVAVAAAGVVVATPETTAEVVHRDEQSFETRLTTSAVVTGDSAVYDRGTRLRDEPVYLLSATPRVDLAAVTSAPGDRPASLSTRLWLEYRAQRDGETVWRRAVPLATRSARVADGRLRTTATLDAAAVRARASEVQQEFGTAATVTVHLRVATRYETGLYEGRLTDRTRLRFRGQSVALAEPVRAGTTRTTPVTRQRTVPPDPGLYGGLGGFGVAALAGAAAVVAARHEAGGPDLDPVALERRLERRRYEEWISVGWLDRSVVGRQVELASLGDLVDLAIDSSERVIHDRRQDLYGVLADDTLYVYHEGADAESGPEEPTPEQGPQTVEPPERAAEGGRPPRPR